MKSDLRNLVTAQEAFFSDNNDYAGSTNATTQTNGDATQFWHVADANTALDGRTLVDVPGDTLAVPKT